jgi:endonuclease III
MKDSKEYSTRIQKLYRTLKQKFEKPPKLEYSDPIEAVVFAIISENMPIDQAQAAFDRIKTNFVDFNDLRVALPEEILETLGGDQAANRQIAANLAAVLNAVFNAFHYISLEDLKKNGKRPAKQALEKLNGVTDFVADYCMLTALDSHAIPLTKEMINYLKTNDYIHPESDEQEIKGFLERQITAKNANEFYYFLRKESDEFASKPVKENKKPKAEGTPKPAKEKQEKQKEAEPKKKEAKKVSKTKSAQKKQTK